MNTGNTRQMAESLSENYTLSNRREKACPHHKNAAIFTEDEKKSIILEDSQNAMISEYTLIA